MPLPIFVPVLELPTDFLQLRVPSSSVRLYSPYTPNEDDATNPATKPPAGESICLLHGRLDDFLHYARGEASDWLLQRAHDICDPSLKRGSLVVWKRHEQIWAPVSQSEQLIASTYVYTWPAEMPTTLTKISHRENRSVTSRGGDGPAMRNSVATRDGGRCWISKVSPSDNRHICPKRMGDHLARQIYEDFTGQTPPPTLRVTDSAFGLSLSPVLGPYFDNYELGLHSIGNNQYEAHSFTTVDEQWVKTVYGTLPKGQVQNEPLLHGHFVVPQNTNATGLPPPGLFRWHYLQCVIKKFGHDDYKKMTNIAYPELPIKIVNEDDSDDEETDSDLEWPSKCWDVHRLKAAEQTEAAERHRGIAQWADSAAG
ncbi:hypothetical protein MIND_00682000 [Mycena indigotica]|uniref:Uncharacterized protein n=1 Tax=Mycena indigotica TaxID=2126181 RepID=A0A8H6SK41_9AGAR|nr:uncharacterized protein MIND_00682000 [Mycena indigotica]KAF7301175.1 hypothetical protein MIND_00682000 [Mycena indigotica]